MSKAYRRVHVDEREYSDKALRAARRLSRRYGNFDDLRERYRHLMGNDNKRPRLDTKQECNMADTLKIANEIARVRAVSQEDDDE